MRTDHQTLHDTYLKCQQAWVLHESRLRQLAAEGLPDDKNSPSDTDTQLFGLSEKSLYTYSKVRLAIDRADSQMTLGGISDLIDKMRREPGLFDPFEAPFFSLLYSLEKSSGVGFLDVTDDRKVEHIILIAMGKVFPYIRVSPKQTVDLIVYILSKGSFIVGDVLEAWGSENPNAVREVIDGLILLDDMRLLRFIRPILLGLAGADWNACWCQLDMLEKARSAPDQILWTYFDLAKRDKVIWSVVLDKAESYSEAFPHDEVIAAAVGVLGRLIATYGDEKARCRSTLELLLNRYQNHTVQWELADWLFRCDEYGTVLDYIEYLLPTEETDKSITDTLDFILNSLIKSAPKDALEFVLKWIASHPGNVEHTDIFNSTYHRIVDNPEALRLLTMWLVDDYRKYKIASDILQENSNWSLDSETVRSWSSAATLKLIKRVVIAVRFNGREKAVVLHNLLSTTGVRLDYEKSLPIVMQYFFSYPGYSSDVFGSSPGKLKGVSRKLIGECIRKLAAYQDDRKKLPALEELRPNLDRLMKIALLEKRRMDEGMHESRENGKFSLLSIMKSVAVARGMDWSSRQDGEFQDHGRMGEMSHSIELPRLELLDPDGQHYRRLMFLKSEENS